MTACVAQGQGGNCIRGSSGVSPTHRPAEPDSMPQRNSVAGLRDGLRLKPELHRAGGLGVVSASFSESSEFRGADTLFDCVEAARRSENSAHCCLRAASVARPQRPSISAVSQMQRHQLSKTCFLNAVSSAGPILSAESEMLQSDFPAQTADTTCPRHAASAIPAELRAGESKINLEFSALRSHLVQRSVPGLPFASSKLLRSA